MPIYYEGWHIGPTSSIPADAKQKSDKTDGTAMEYAVYHEADVLPVPEFLSYEEAACTVALANKMARVVWALMARGGVYQAPVQAA